jgi:beta-aspartyl-peptidase (threonine type)
MKPSLIVHGGAWTIPHESVDACRAGCRRALEAGWSILQGGGAAADAVEAAIVVLEDDPVFDAGIGSHLNRDGGIELDAIIMDGGTLDAGAVAGVQRLRNPIRLARRVLEQSEHLMLMGAGAEEFAVEHGIALCDPEELVAPAERAAWLRCRETGHNSRHHLGDSQGTVGAVALDRNGGLVAGTSTGGTCCKLPGRVGDSPLIGCGCYADALAGGISCTGWGEAIMKIVMAKTAADLLRPLDGGAPLSSQAAADTCVRLLADRAHGTGGLILLDREGRPAFAFNTPQMAHGYVSDKGELVTGV